MLGMFGFASVEFLRFASSCFGESWPWQFMQALKNAGAPIVEGASLPYLASCHCQDISDNAARRFPVICSFTRPKSDSLLVAFCNLEVFLCSRVRQKIDLPDWKSVQMALRPQESGTQSVLAGLRCYAKSSLHSFCSLAVVHFATPLIWEQSNCFPGMLIHVPSTHMTHMTSYDAHATAPHNVCGTRTSKTSGSD